MNVFLQTSTKLIQEKIQVTGSKSETNRLLMLKAIYPNLTIENISNSDDAQVMQKGLPVISGVVDIHHAGTAMRFLTAFFATTEGREVILTGSGRMKERPIKILVDALAQLGAEISYVEEEGYPPLKIKGKKITASKVSLAANVSSQYISALLLNAPKLDNGLELTLEGEITSVPYIKMTLALLKEIGITTSFEGQVIRITPKNKVARRNIVVESDWSSASYFYSIAALSNVGTQITLSAYKNTSLQGDSVLQEIYTQFGVTTSFNEHFITLKKENECEIEKFTFDLSNAPDIAQTIAVTCFGLGIACDLSGLHTLKIKETDRLVALKNELSKFGAYVDITDKELFLHENSEGYNKNISIETYNDHRMAMAFAPLALKVPFTVLDAEVVSKSYPDFWSDMEKLHFQVTKQ
ncbi:3-phosphoshikimate 1-carboxyvinyltransferase [Zhouia sp. PK063]|uniref:3-phosphoshikimate 1-carboxyvinyltransferase n=1 Tax=Zhouia sp. PK063 TaxID=3373602 RepID=UPI0037B11DE9